MTTRAGPSLIAGKTVAGFNTRGVLGSVILSDAAAGDYGAGVLNNDSLVPTAEYWVLIESSSFPAGTFRLNENGSGEYTAAGAIIYRLYENGADQGTASFTGSFGATVNAVMAAQETGDDVFAGTVAVQRNIGASMAVVEVGDDVFSAYAFIRGSINAELAVAELGDDVFAATVLVTTRRKPIPHFATEADMLVRFSETELVQLTNRNKRATTIDSLVLDRALTDADAEIEARLVARYTLPLATVPWLLVNLACDIARWRLYDDRATDQVTRRYEDAVKRLSEIASGKLSLGLDAEAAATPPVDGPTATPTTRVFSRDLLKDYGG